MKPVENYDVHFAGGDFKSRISASSVPGLYLPVVLLQAVSEGQDYKTLCCLWCKSGPIEAICRLDRTGYIPGEDIVINAEITNGSNRKVSRSYVELVQVP